MSYFLSTAGRVVSCAFYLITGVVSGGIMVMFMGMQGSLGSGAPSVTMYVSLLGSLLLAGAAVMALFRFRGTGYVAVTGVIAVWTFYIAMMLSSLTPVATSKSASRTTNRPVPVSSQSSKGLPIVPLVIVPLLLLISLAYPVASIVGTRKIEA